MLPLSRVANKRKNAAEAVTSAVMASGSPLPARRYLEPLDAAARITPRIKRGLPRYVTLKLRNVPVAKKLTDRICAMIAARSAVGVSKAARNYN